MRSDRAPRQPGRWAAGAIGLFAALLIGLVVHGEGWQPGWRVFGVGTRDAPWLDLQVITSSAQTAAEGGNPYLANPHDPTGRPLNYPSPWLWFFPAHISPGAVSAVALGFAAAAFATLLLWLGSCGMCTGVMAGLLLLSPSLLLAVERGNTDLPVFALVGLSLLAIGSRPRWLSRLGVLGLLLACLLKLFPVIALGLVIVVGPPAVRRMAWFALALFVAWLGLHASETALVLANTRAGAGAVHSYGRSVLPFALELYARAHGQVLARAPLDLLANVLTAVVLISMGWLGGKLGAASLLSPSATPREIGALTGAALYVLTFLAGSSFNYRLWFLLFTLPWLLSLAEPGHPAMRWARAALAGFVVLLFASAVWWVPLVWVAQAASWVLFAALTALLAGCAASRRKSVNPAFFPP